MSNEQETKEKEKEKKNLTMKLLDERVKILEQNWVFGQENKTDKLLALYCKNRFAGAIPIREQEYLDSILGELGPSKYLKRIKALEEENKKLKARVEELLADLEIQ